MVAASKLFRYYGRLFKNEEKHFLLEINDGSYGSPNFVIKPNKRKANSVI